MSSYASTRQINILSILLHRDAPGPADALLLPLETFAASSNTDGSSSYAQTRVYSIPPRPVALGPRAQQATRTSLTCRTAAESFLHQRMTDISTILQLPEGLGREGNRQCNPLGPPRRYFETNCQAFESNRPLSVNFNSGMTGRHIKAIVMKGAFIGQPAFAIVSHRT